MATNTFKIFDEDNINLLSDANYEADSQRISGVIPGIARSDVHNKLYRQCSIMAYAFGEIIKSKGYNASDADASALVTALTNSLVPELATESLNGLLSSTDKTKLNTLVLSDLTVNKVLTTEDLDTVITSGIYRLGSANSNMPSGCASGQLLVMHGAGNSIAQIAVSYTDQNIWIRSGSPTNVGGSGTYSTWRKVISVANASTAGQFDNTTTAPTDTTRLNYNGYLYATRIYNAVYNDLAEYMICIDPEAKAGDILESTVNGLRRATRNSRSVIGVFSDTYGYALGADKIEDKIPIAISGRVLTKIIGDPQIGDLITSGDNGIGIINNSATIGTIVGKVFDGVRQEDGRYWIIVTLI